MQRQTNSNPISELNERQIAVTDIHYIQCKNGPTHVGWKCDLTAQNQSFEGWGLSKKVAKKSAAANACKVLLNLDYQLNIPNLDDIKNTCVIYAGNGSFSSATNTVILRNSSDVVS